MNLPDEPQRKRKVGFHATKTMLHCSNVIGDFLDIIDGNTRHSLVLE
ncbi:MAG: hypothetical protein WA581_12510 [Candidatus Acidiferrales bacterium]